MGGLADNFDELRENFRPRMKGPPCAVGELRKKMSPTDREAFEVLLDDTRVHSTAIARRLEELAESEKNATLATAMRNTSYQAIQRHRRKGCRCDKRG
jgi:hypothetical protein